MGNKDFSIDMFADDDEYEYVFEKRQQNISKEDTDVVGRSESSSRAVDKRLSVADVLSGDDEEFDSGSVSGNSITDGEVSRVVVVDEDYDDQGWDGFEQDDPVDDDSEYGYEYTDREYYELVESSALEEDEESDSLGFRDTLSTYGEDQNTTDVRESLQNSATVLANERSSAPTVDTVRGGGDASGGGSVASFASGEGSADAGVVSEASKSSIGLDGRGASEGSLDGEDTVFGDVENDSSTVVVQDVSEVLEETVGEVESVETGKRRGFDGFVNPVGSGLLVDDAVDKEFAKKQRESALLEDVSEARALGGYIAEKTEERLSGKLAEKNMAKRKKKVKAKRASELSVAPIAERVVGVDGSDGRDFSARARVAKKPTSGTKRTLDNGKLSEREIMFFNNLALDPNSPASFDRVRKLLRPPVSKEEAERSYRSRMELLNIALGDERSEKFGKRVKGLQSKDIAVLQFIAQFKYVTESHIASLLGVTNTTAKTRLGKLKQLGMVRGINNVYGALPLFSLTRVGMLLSGYDLKPATENNITYAMIPHQFTVTHVAANVYSGALNVLNEDEYPVMNRTNPRSGELVYGDEVVSETSIQSSFSRLRGIMKASDYRKKANNIIEATFQEWENGGGASGGVLSPEFEWGNEFMWVLLPPISAGIQHHIPDLVVKRKRDADGSPNSIAVEVELSDKGSDEAYQRTMEAYRTDTRFYKKVVWICRAKGQARRIERIARENGMWKSGRVEIWPIYTKDGIFKGGDLWQIGAM